MVFLSLLILISLSLGYYYSGEYGNKAWLIFGTISVLGLALLLTQFIKKPPELIAPVSVPVSTALERAFARSAHAGVIVENGRAVRANESYLELVQSLGLNVTDTDPPLPEKLFENTGEHAKAALFRLAHLKDSDAFGEEEIEYLSKDNELCRYLLRVTVYQNQQVWEVLDFNSETGDEAGLLATAPIGLCAITEEGRLIASNDILRRWLGVEDEIPADIKSFIEHPEGVIDTPKDANRTIRFDTRLITQKDVATPIVLIAKWIKQASGRYVASIALHGHSSISVAGGKAESGLTAGAGSAFSGVNTDVPFAMVDLDHSDLKTAKIVSANAAFARLTGLEECEGRILSDIIGANNSGINVYDVDPGNLTPDQPIDAIIKSREGVSVSVVANSDPATGRCRLFLIDISARKVLEDQLVQSQKMQAIGRLVAEIAHDFNNLLAAIRLYTDTLIGRHPIGDPSYAELQQINANVNRAAALVKKLLGYSRKQTIRAELLNVSETLSDMAITLKQVLGEKVQLEIKHGRNLPPIRVDKSQFDTVLMNLAVNARDAMKEQGGGKIKIISRQLSKLDIDNPSLKASLETVESDNVIAISVSDTGTGMTEEVKNKIFEPFFTTKGQGEGTGLGLATVYGIVQQSGGYLAVDSELGKGTTFTIYLPEIDPATIEAEAPPAKPAVPSVRRPSDLAGSGNILFVEDEDSVRIIAAKTLRKRGYTVTEARDGEEAFEIIEDTDTPFDLMISDVVMPGMDGPTLLKKARPMLSDTRIVFISGYAEEEFSDLLAEEPDVTFLPKPFTLVQLAEKVKQQIGEAV